MEPAEIANKPLVIPDFLSGGGEMGRRIREFDWSKTALGPVNTWPQSLQSALSICLNSNFPIAIYWGEDLVLLYNDAWSPIPGNKHPWALGQTAKEVWPDIWEDIEPQFQKAFRGEPGGSKDALLPMQRHGYTEECYFDFTFTPVFGEKGKLDGIFNAVIETTYRVINERRTSFLQRFSNNLAAVHSFKGVFGLAARELAANPKDIPFALIYTVNRQGISTLEASTLGVDSTQLHKDWPVDTLLKSGQPLRVQGIEDYLASVPKGYWPESSKEAVIHPLKGSDGAINGYIVFGISSRRSYDNEYQSFLESIANALSTVINTIRSLEEERRRAETLAEIDRSKTTFFSNISHEFRTPLTLLLGPIEEVLHDPNTIQPNRYRVEVAQRNALRMQKLVNTLLEFTRIEAGRAEGRFSRVDICTFTQNLVSTFRSAIEKAGMQLVFDCASVKSAVYVDIDMWEKIVLNLLSNAFKYTSKGKIEVQVEEVDNRVQLTVTDTGAGIPEDQLDKVFDRFHRIENTGGRSQEGTGIGLAMVRELVKLHQGSIRVHSRLGEGSQFIVSIPIGKEHLPADKIVESGEASSSPTIQSDAYVQEAMRWIPSDAGAAGKKNVHADLKAYKVLLADDNADMREYVQHLLEGHFTIFTAVDGEEAFDKLLQYKPDLLIADIMMPKLDGFGLLRKVRSHPDVKSTPVIFLSARAGEEAKLEGLEAGADDYLVKPFSAKELYARVESTIKVAKSRLAAETNLRNVIMQSPVATTLLRGPSMIIEIVNDTALEVWGRPYDDVINRPIVEAMPELVEQHFDQLLHQVYTTGVPFKGYEFPVELFRFGKPETVYLNFIYEPLRNDTNEVVGIIGIGVDVSEQVIARKKIEQSQNELNLLANAMPQLVWVSNPDGVVTYYNDRVSEFAGAHRNADGTWSWEGLVHPDDLEATEQAWKEAVQKGSIYQMEHRIKMKDGSYRWFLSRAYPYWNEEGKLVKWFGTATDIHASKEYATVLEEDVEKRTRQLSELNLSLQRSNHELQQFAHVASHDLKEPLRKVRTFAGRLADDPDTIFSEKAKIYMDKINSAANRMSSMIEGVLSYSMLNASEQKVETVDLGAVVRDITSDLELLITQKGATLHYYNLPHIEGAAVLLHQLFYNLVNNSLKFSRPGVAPQIVITASVVNKEGEDYAQVMFEDNGIGFDNAFSEKIFDPFMRLNSKDRYEGTGLGLSLCKRIIERHHGIVRAVGKKDEGSIFIVQLPVKQKQISI